MLKSLSKLSESGMMSRLHLNLRYLNVSEHMEILQCDSSVPSGTCYVYLLPIHHLTAEARKASMSLVGFLQPDLVFLELDATRDFRLRDPECEMGVANNAAKALELDVFLGDISQAAWEEFEENIKRRLGEQYYTGNNLFEIKGLANDKAVVDVRNRLMVDKIWHLAKRRNSILGIFGSDHLYGMVHHWKQKKLGCLAMDAEALIYKNSLLKSEIEKAYTLREDILDAQSKVTRARFMRMEVKEFDPDDVAKMRLMKEELRNMKTFTTPLYDHMRLPGVEDHDLDEDVFGHGDAVRVRSPTDYNPSLAAALGPCQPSANLNLADVGPSAGNDESLVFVENFVKDRFVPTMFVDYRKGVQQAISSPAAFRPRAHVVTTYTSSIENGRPLLQGLLTLDYLTSEVLGWAQAMPKFANDLVKCVQTFLERTYERCRTSYMAGM